MAYIAGPNLLLPWSSSLDEDKRFKKVFLILLIPFLLLSIAIPLINIPVPDREELEKLPPQLARVVIEKKDIPKPPPPPPKEEKKEEKKEPKKEKPKPEPKKPRLVEAKEAATAEINQFADALADMRDSFDLSEVNQELTQSTGEAAQIDRSIIGARAKGGSGGINTSALSRNTGGVALSGKKTTKVDSKLATATGKATKAKKAPARDKSYRSDEDVRKTMDRNKGAIFGVYNKALRKNPSLEGKVVFKLVINGSGQVTSASVVSSELNDPALERKLLLRIKLINFGKKDVLQTTLEYAFEFLPY